MKLNVRIVAEFCGIVRSFAECFRTVSGRVFFNISDVRLDFCGIAWIFVVSLGFFWCAVRVRVRARLRGLCLGIVVMIVVCGSCSSSCSWS